MKKIAVFVLVIMVVVCRGAMAGEKAPGKVLDLVPKLAKYGTDTAIAAAVKAQNAKGMSLEKIKDMDKAWMATPGVNDFMKSLMANACAQKIRSIKGSAPYFAEIFVMDDKGAIVCMTDKTSDYWQGDEAKWTKSYNNGAGGKDVSDVKFDDSTQAYLVQMSFPVRDGARVIGAMTLGVNVEKVK